MTRKQFDNLVEMRVQLIESVLLSKAKEYSKGDDRLHNFNVAARIWNTTPEKALWGMAMKHLVSVVDMIENPKDLTPGHISEKVGDMINYLILLEAMLYERNAPTGGHIK